ncbi:RNA-guided endonuclease InsQ/TnpB family protein (plasmid) [Anabaena sp. FACHB-709]|uniref:Transposase n=2 Tax=Nostocaceae TaxID=1162 RepID=A0A1Z4KV13_ANAVA|nr:MULTISPECIES: RNA-guided endonuclease TnpB family protein [Nostocaceae]BAY72861.1 transposase [Trichormus variabilis NIES-23]MBD2175158.1 transposase [Anabaena cylindrica FACHB-318]MBD2267051.1 transposase [Anabaena sp. FACHB-709]MBD2276601.1 transposase [Nostoc sp. PCC 7120 = FACHB-418]MBD2287124.1 transposase [Anabaena cylindrica FACHB-170]
MLLTYQFKLNPTSEQVVILETWGELLRRHWNYALGERLDWLRRTRSLLDRCSLVSEPIGGIPDKPDYYTQASDLQQTKDLFPDYKNIYADCQQQNLMRLDKAWKRWLIPDKKGNRGGKPRFKKRGDISSFTFPRVNSPKAGAHLTGNILKLSKIGEIEVILHRPIPNGSEIKQATILSKSDGWYVSFSLEDKTVPELLPIDEIKTATGIDVGLEKFLTTAHGQSIEVPQYSRKTQSKLARQQRKLARKIHGSKNYQKQASRVARIHLHVARQRKEFHYQVAHWLVKSYDLIVFENLNIRGLARTRLAKSILDVAWGAFLQIMQAVAVRRGKHTRGVDPRGTSINCSGCGQRVEKTLAVRVHNCSCGLVIDRDWNSAINLLNYGSVGLPIPGCGGLGVSQPVKQQVSYVNLRCSRYTACS